MNILILNWRDIKHPEAGGAEVHLHEIFGRLVARKHNITLLTTQFAGAATEEYIDGIRVLRYGHTYTFNWESPLLVRRILRTAPVDCIIDDVNKIPFFTPRWFPKVPSCAFFHHLFGQTVFELTAPPLAAYVLALEKLSGWGYKKVPVCTVSKSTAHELVEHGFSSENITIIENSVDTDLYTPDAGTKESDHLLYFGRLKRYKNVSILLRVVKKLCEEGRNMRLTVAGCGDDGDNLKQLAQELGISDRVSFPGFVDEQTKIQLYRRATLFINPSRKEGWGITNIEANACGTAVIANDAPGLRDSVIHEKTGLLYKENDEQDLSRRIVMLLEDKSKRSAMETEGRNWALSFSWDNSATKVERWLENVCRKK
ncbi:MAG: glycosyltransferase family 4 protein [Fibrobacterota bacterium]